MSINGATAAQPLPPGLIRSSSSLWVPRGNTGGWTRLESLAERDYGYNAAIGTSQTWRPRPAPPPMARWTSAGRLRAMMGRWVRLPSYLVRYSTAAIDSEGAWSSATIVTTGIPTPAVSGTAQSMTRLGSDFGHDLLLCGACAGCWTSNLGDLSNSPSAVASTITSPGAGKYDDSGSGSGATARASW